MGVVLGKYVETGQLDVSCGVARRHTANSGSQTYSAEQALGDHCALRFDDECIRLVRTIVDVSCQCRQHTFLSDSNKYHGLYYVIDLR